MVRFKSLFHRARRSKAETPRVFTDEKGAVAIEFAYLALPFFLVLFCLLETCLVFAGQIALGQATERMARAVQLGVVAKEKPTADEFRRRLCDLVVMPLQCEKLKIALGSYSTFTEVAGADLRADHQVSPDYETGRPGEIMALSIAYEWPLHVDLVRKYLATDGTGAHTLRLVRIFKTEPFEQ